MDILKLMIVFGVLVVMLCLKLSLIHISEPTRP